MLNTEEEDMTTLEDDDPSMCKQWHDCKELKQEEDDLSEALQGIINKLEAEEMMMDTEEEEMMTNKKCDKDCALCVGSRTNCTHCNLGRELFFDKHHKETRCRDIEYHHENNTTNVTNSTNSTECKRDHYFDEKDAECRECAD